jgi:hypothetical protein
LGGFETSFTFTYVPVERYIVTNKIKYSKFTEHPPADTIIQTDGDFSDKLHNAVGSLSYSTVTGNFCQCFGSGFNQVSGRGSKRPKRIPTKI